MDKFVQEWPINSKLDPQIYGPPESMLTTEIIEAQIGGLIKVHEVSADYKIITKILLCSTF
jgi:lipoxygenase